MPKSTRDTAQRELDRSVGNIEWANTHILRTAQVYLERHPEIADPLITASDLLDEVVKLVKAVRYSF